MSRTSLRTISLGLLLLFGEQVVVAGRSKCIGKGELMLRIQKFEKTLGPSTERLRPNNNTTCEEAARMPTTDLPRRSLSPWTYWLDQKDNRRPRDIFMAKCLCQGCIINQQESYTYNSVEVTKNMMVLYIHPCRNDPGKHMVTEELLQVSVACTCALPKYAA